MNDLLADFDKSFGKKAAQTAKRVKKAAEAKGKRFDSEQDRIVYLEKDQSYWTPTHRVTHIMTQTCECCGGESEYVAGEHIRHQHVVHATAIWDCVMPIKPEHDILPLTVVNHSMHIAQCPSCVRMETVMCTLPRQREIQYDLFSKDGEQCLPSLNIN